MVVRRRRWRRAAEEFDIDSFNNVGSTDRQRTEQISGRRVRAEVMRCSIAAASLVALAATGADAFAPSHGVARCVPSSSLAAAATLEEQTKLSESEEDVLFGTPSTTHRSVKTQTGVIRSLNQPNPLDHSSDPLVNKLRSMRETIQACPLIWRELAEHCPDNTALLDEHLCDTDIDLTFSEVESKVRKSAQVFKELGVTKGVNVAILGENSAMWLLADHGIQLAGGASAVRGADAPLDELRYIYEHSDSAGVAVVQDIKLVQKLAKDAKARGLGPLGLQNESHGSIKTVILMHKGKSTTEEIEAIGAANNVDIRVLSELMDSTSPAIYNELPPIAKSDLSTIVYTSGTTGKPKVRKVHAAKCNHEP